MPSCPRVPCLPCRLWSYQSPTSHVSQFCKINQRGRWGREREREFSVKKKKKEEAYGASVRCKVKLSIQHGGPWHSKTTHSWLPLTKKMAPSCKGWQAGRKGRPEMGTGSANFSFHDFFCVLFFFILLGFRAHGAESCSIFILGKEHLPKVTGIGSKALEIHHMPKANFLLSQKSKVIYYKDKLS